MSCNGLTIASHLLNNHKLTISDYEKSYLSAPGTEDQDDGQEEEEEQQLQHQQQQGYILYKSLLMVRFKILFQNLAGYLVEYPAGLD